MQAYHSQQAMASTVQVAGKTTCLRYLLFLPPGYGAERARRWPLILFLHGKGERGDDLELLKRHGLPRVLEQRPDLPCIVASPQCPANSDWSELMDGLCRLLDELTARYAVDPDRCYLTGLSMGGRAAWQLAATCPQRFAAVVPICGNVSRVPGLLERLCALRDTPVWVFHGARDPIVPLAESEQAVRALRACGGNVRLTVYPEGEHDAWTEAYASPDLYAWLLAQRRHR